MMTELEKLRAENKALKEEVARLKQEIANIKRMLGLDSSNSSKPPTSDGLRKKPAPQSLRPIAKNPSGGQKGHKGFTLKQVQNPDHVIKHEITECPKCGNNLATLPINNI